MKKHQRCSMAVLLSAVMLYGCGDGSSPTTENSSAAPTGSASTPTPATTPATPSLLADEMEVEPTRSPVVLAVRHQADQLTAKGSPLTLDAAGGTLLPDASAYTVYVNDELVKASALTVTATSLQVNTALIDGINTVAVYAPDTAGNPIESVLTFGAGAAKVTGRVIDKNGNPVAGAKVVASLGDKADITAAAVTNTAGAYTMTNFPSRTVLVSVLGPTGIPGASSGVGGGVFPDTVLVDFGTPVATLNNDFSAGTTGWVNLTGANLSLVDHVEAVGPAPAPVTAPTVTSMLRRINRLLPISTAVAQSVPNKDLKISTSGQGPRTVTYTFTPTEDTSSVKLRYRFQTAEFPVYYNTGYNDAFEVKLRSADGANTSVAATMNGLGSGEFDASGSTAWKELTLDLPASGSPAKPVQVDITVANVGDGAVDSSVIVDMASTSKVAITSASLFDIDQSALTHFSAAPHSFFGGNTRVNATFALKGPADSTVKSLSLKVFQGGVLKAKGDLVPGLASSVLKPFGAQGTISKTDNSLAFEVPSSQLGATDLTKDGSVTLKLEVTTDKGETAVKEITSVPVLALWTGSQRYGERNDSEGGDGWVRPSARDVFLQIPATYGDFSNMHGGKLAPHDSHRTGQDVDGWFSGYNERNANTAAKLIALINTAGVQKKVKVVYVTYSATAGNKFYGAIKDVTLADGRPATAVFKPYAHHDTHFHLNAQ